MNRFPDFQTDLLFSDTAAPTAETPAAEVAAEVSAPETAAATTEVPLAPPMTGVLEPISGGQSFSLVLFGLLALAILIGMTRFGRNHDYGD